MDIPEAIYRPSVLIVIDSHQERSALAAVLTPLYVVVSASTAREAWMYLGSRDLPDLILIDENPSEEAATQFCRQLKGRSETRDIPIIVLHEQAGTAIAPLTAALDINDYFFKPIEPASLLIRIAHQLRLKSAAAFIKDRRVFLEEEVDRHSKEINLLKEVAFLALASLAEIRDFETEEHARRTQHYVMALVDDLASDPKFANDLGLEERELLFNAAPLHDIGKIGIPDAVLLKAGPLASDERELMKTHTTLGRDAIQKAEDQLGISVPFLGVVKELTYSHHERWDGHGYPEGRMGDDIPLSARIMAVADVYDALVTRRSYKAPMPHDQVVAFIVGRRSIDFDPDITDAFVRLQARFLMMSKHFSDTDRSRT
ncbi:HD domain-containing phosphohydrolase [Dyella sp. 2YAF14]|jgi:putative two-component system response regulator|uniref:HD domain-containing phosphohydrolase n=1 Tax=Dyella sp. 2YAF14 TaxID=3233025 RepID=UPI003F929D9E